MVVFKTTYLIQRYQII